MVWKRAGRVTNARERKLAMLWPYSDVEVPESWPPIANPTHPLYRGMWRQTAVFKLDAQRRKEDAARRRAAGKSRRKPATPSPSPSPSPRAVGRSNRRPSFSPERTVSLSPRRNRRPSFSPERTASLSPRRNRRPASRSPPRNTNAASRRRCEEQGKVFNPITKKCNTPGGSSHRAYLAAMRKRGVNVKQ